MYVDATEFDAAFVAVKKEYPKISKELAHSFISKLGDAIHSRRGQAFGELLRLALNDSHIWERVDREPYKVLAGKFFGRRGGHAAHRERAADTKNKKTSPRKTTDDIQVVTRPNGQLAWKI